MQQTRKQSQHVRGPAFELLCISFCGPRTKKFGNPILGKAKILECDNMLKKYVGYAPTNNNNKLSQKYPANCRKICSF